jgi:hypothetical protein
MNIDPDLLKLVCGGIAAAPPLRRLLALLCAPLDLINQSASVAQAAITPSP